MKVIENVKTNKILDQQAEGKVVWPGLE